MNLPTEIIIQISKYLDIGSYNTLRCASKSYFHELSACPSLHYSAFITSLSSTSRGFDLEYCSFEQFEDLMEKLDSFDIFDHLKKAVHKYGHNPFIRNNRLMNLALIRNDLEFIDFLLEDERFDPNGSLLLLTAVEHKQFQAAFRLLQDNRFDPTAENYSVLREAAANSIDYIVSFYVPLVSDRILDSLFIIACNHGSVSVVKLLLLNGVDPSIYDNYGIQVACKESYLQLVEILIKDERVNPSANDNYALKCARRNLRFDIEDLLLKRMDISYKFTQLTLELTGVIPFGNSF